MIVKPINFMHKTAVLSVNINIEKTIYNETNIFLSHKKMVVLSHSVIGNCQKICYLEA
jgi:hypothetical protein